MKIKRTWRERLFSLTPWVKYRPETEADRLRRFAETMQPSMPMGFDPLVKPTVTVRDYLAEKGLEKGARK